MHYRNIPKTLLFLLLCCPSMGLTGCSTTAQGDTGSFSPADYVNPFIGASTSTSAAGVYHGLGKTFPGATTPYGMVQVSPNTITGGDNSPGYSYEHTTIEGFAFTQMSGVGWFGDLGRCKRSRAGRTDRSGVTVPITTRPRKPRARGITAPC